MTDDNARLPGWVKVSDLLGTVVAALNEVRAARKVDVGQLEESLQKLRSTAGSTAKENAGKLAARVEERRRELEHVDAALARIEELYFALGQLEVDVRGKSGDYEDKAKQLVAFEELHKATVAGLSTQIAMFHDDLRAAKRRIQDLTAAHDVATADAARVADEAAALATKNEQERGKLQNALAEANERAAAEASAASTKYEQERATLEQERAKLQAAFAADANAAAAKHEQERAQLEQDRAKLQAAFAADANAAAAKHEQERAHLAQDKAKLQAALADQASVMAELRSVVDALTSSLPPEPAALRAAGEVAVPVSADAQSTAAWPAPSEHGTPPPPPLLPTPPASIIASPMPVTAQTPLPQSPSSSSLPGVQPPMGGPSASGLQEIDFDIDDPSVSALSLPARIDLSMYVKPTAKLAQLKGGAREIKIAGILSHWDGADIQRIIDISKLPDDEVLDCVRAFLVQGFVTLEKGRSEKSEPLPPSPSN